MKVTIQKPVLKITSGKTKHPFREIESDRFLIGAGNCCQLQLSAEEIPMVFAIVHQVASGYQIEALHPEPAMFVNDSQKQFAILQPGDQLSLGPYRFEFLIEQAEHVLRATPEQHAQKESGVAQAIGTENQPVSDHRISPVPSKIEELTAEEIVTRIEKELVLIEQLESEQESQPESKTSRKSA